MITHAWYLLIITGHCCKFSERYCTTAWATTVTFSLTSALFCCQKCRKNAGRNTVHPCRHISTAFLALLFASLDTLNGPMRSKVYVSQDGEWATNGKLDADMASMPECNIESEGFLPIKHENCHDGCETIKITNTHFRCDDFGVRAFCGTSTSCRRSMFYMRRPQQTR